MNAVRTRWRDDRGSVSIEMALCYVPLMILAARAMVTGVRLASAASDVNAAAAAGARQSSLARSPGAAIVAGRDGATATLVGRRLTCQPSSVEVDASAMGSGRPVVVGGTRGRVPSRGARGGGAGLPSDAGALAAAAAGNQADLANAVVGSGEQWITDLSDDELADLVTLRAAA